MFSSIIGLLEKLQELKLKKQKRDTKKEVKKAEKKLKEEGSSVVNVKDKAKKTKKVKDSKENEKKLQIKVWILKVLKWVLEIIEQFIMFLISIIGVYGFFIILVVIVLMIAIYGLLHIDFDMSDGSVFRRSQNEECIQQSQVLNSVNWSELNINSLNGTMTEYQKNLYKTFTLVDEFLKGDGTNIPAMKELPHDIAFKVYRGIPAVESSFYIFGPSDTSHDVLKDMLDSSENDAYIGPHQIAKGSSLDYSEYYKFWSGNSFVDSWKTKYPKPGSAKDHFWMPYSVGMSLMHSMNMGTYGNLNTTSSGYGEFKTFVESSMDHFGINANREECFQYIRALMSVSCYLQGQGMAFLNYNTGSGGGAARINYMCAVFAASSDDDTKRSFNNYSIILNDETKYKYAEGGDSLRTYLIGSKGYDSYISDIGSLTISGNPKLQVGTTPLTVPLMKYIYDKYKDDPYMSQTWTHIKGVKGQYLSSYHYGLACLWQGNHIEAELGITVPMASGGSVDNCECEESPSFISDILLSGLKEGTAQGPWDTDLLSKINQRMSNGATGKFKDFFGKTFGIPELTAEAEEWRKNSKWKVPYYFQDNRANIKFNSNGLRFCKDKGSLNACGTHMLAYLMSASTGRVINPIEAFAVGLEKGIFESTGAMSYHKFDTLKEYGINIKHVEGGNDSSMKALVDKCLENGGLVGLRSEDSNNIFVYSEHFFVITEKVGDKYNVFSASNFEEDKNGPYDWNTVTLGAVRFFLTDVSSAPAQTNAGVSFEKFLFIGDSYTDGLKTIINGENKNHIVKAVVGEDAAYWNSNYTELQGHDVNGIVVLLGANNTTDVDGMKTLLNNLKADYSGKPIYVQKVFPVGSNYTYIDAATQKGNIEKYNNEIKTFCDSDTSFTFIDTTTGLVGSDGYLSVPDGEGIHLGNNDEYKKWWENIKTSIEGDKSENQNLNVNCVTKGESGSIVGAIDLDTDVIDKADYCKPNLSNFSSARMRPADEIQFIVVHYWGSSNSSNCTTSGLVSAYHNANMPNGMAQYLVGSDGIVLVAPELMQVPHCGGGTHLTVGHPEWNTLECYNSNSIGIEVGNLCVNGKYVYTKSCVEYTVGLTKALMAKYNIDIDHVYRHYDCTLKRCPWPFVDDAYANTYDFGESHNWKAFKKCLQSDSIDWSLFNDSVIDD